MLRFLVGGLSTVAGLVLLFVASFGEPAALLRRFDTASPLVAAQQTAQPAAPTVPAAPPAALQQERATLEQRIQELQSQAEQATQAVTSLNSQASRERQELEALRQQRAAAEASVEQLKAERQQAEAVAASAPPAAAQAPTQVATADIPPPPPAPQPAALPASADASKPATTPPAAPAPRPMAEPKDTAPPPPPLPESALPTPNSVSGPEVAAVTKPPARPTQPIQTARAAPPRPPAVANPAPPAGQASDHPSPAGPPVAAVPRPRPGRPDLPRAEAADNNTTEAVLDRLRRQPTLAAGSDSGRGIADGPGYDEMQPNGPRARLGSARAALQAGRVEEARRLLESAQLQLVFRPVTPSGDGAPGASRRAGEVAEALSMLGAGDREDALAYIDRAMGESGDRPPPLQQGYGYAGPPPYNNAATSYDNER